MVRRRLTKASRKSVCFRGEIRYFADAASLNHS
jgi:hypothetical protein